MISFDTFTKSLSPNYISACKR